MSPIHIRIVNKSCNALPEYATAGASGMDIRANLDEPVIVKSLERVLIPTGLYIELPQGYEVQIRPRSGLAIKHGITCLNTPGTIDADYRGEIQVILVNLGREDFFIERGLRIAQMILSPISTFCWREVEQHPHFAQNMRQGGFGSTGRGKCS